jgi:hypothetical protein
MSIEQAFTVEQPDALLSTTESVEDSAVIDFERKESCCDLLGQASTTETTVDERTTDESSSLVPLASDVSVSDVSEDPKSNLRLWFESLSNEDRLTALGFQDEVFLKEFLAVAPWCLATATDDETSCTTGKSFH